MARIVIPPEWLAEKITTCQQGGRRARRAWGELAEKLYPVLLKMAYAQQARWRPRLQSPDIPHDAAQHAFLRLLTNVHQLTEPEGTLSWVRVIIRNYYYESASRGFGQREIVTAEQWPFELKAYYDISYILSAGPALRTLIAELPSQSRKLLYDVYWLERPLYDIAIEQGVSSHQAITGRLGRIHALLRQQLLKMGYGPTDTNARAGTGSD